MGVLNTRKNKKYSYQPRYYKGEGNPFELKNKFGSAIDDFKYNGDKTGANRRILYIIAALVLVFLFIIDFDLSIFSIES
jgi:hypothetical protein